MPGRPCGEERLEVLVRGALLVAGAVVGVEDDHGVGVLGHDRVDGPKELVVQVLDLADQPGAVRLRVDAEPMQLRRRDAAALGVAVEERTRAAVGVEHERRVRAEDVRHREDRCCFLDRHAPERGQHPEDSLAMLVADEARPRSKSQLARRGVAQQLLLEQGHRPGVDDPVDVGDGRLAVWRTRSTMVRYPASSNIAGTGAALIAAVS